MVSSGSSSSSSSSSSSGAASAMGADGGAAGGGGGGGGRALDLHAHDAPRYVGGMLAWMHQAIASELEFLEAIFGEQHHLAEGYKNTGTSSSHTTGSGSGSGQQQQQEQHQEQQEGKVSSAEEEPPTAVGLTVPELLARCLQGLGRPLRVRIVQTLETKSGLEVLYSLVDLLAFYQLTFERIIPMENAVHSAVKGCLKECRRMFVSALNKQAESLTQSPVTYPLDLKASHVTRECALQVKEILRIASGALSDVISSDAEDSCHIDSVLGSIIQPLLQSCRMGGQALQPAEMATFLLNNVSVLQHEISEASKRTKQSYRSASWLSLLHTEADTWMGVLVQEEVARALHRSDLDKLLELMEVVPVGVVGLRAVEQVGLSNDQVAIVMRAFYASLFSTSTAQFERLQDSQLREVLRNSIAEKLATAHAKVKRSSCRDMRRGEAKRHEKNMKIY
mmetsp:Transcript_13400/g.22339  ORF Transcript_13400/g.22339 Transcript_13400/m.22339 type:complete len:450 (-) Transcript_13400:496-1845(-)